MMRPKRRFIIPLKAARDRRKAAPRLTSSTVCQSSSFIRSTRPSRVKPGIVDQDVELAQSRLGVLRQLLHGEAIGEIAYQHRRAPAEFGRQCL